MQVKSSISGAPALERTGRDWMAHASVRRVLPLTFGDQHRLGSKCMCVSFQPAPMYSYVHNIRILCFVGNIVIGSKLQLLLKPPCPAPLSVFHILAFQLLFIPY